VLPEIKFTFDVYNEIKARTLSQVRGTVQADILKKIRHKILVFSTEFAFD
jgi:methylmalonyl-CoA mutase